MTTTKVPTFARSGNCAQCVHGSPLEDVCVHCDAERILLDLETEAAMKRRGHAIHHFRPGRVSAGAELHVFREGHRAWPALVASVKAFGIYPEGGCLYRFNIPDSGPSEPLRRADALRVLAERIATEAAA